MSRGAMAHRPPRNTSFAHVSRFLEGMQARIGGGGGGKYLPTFRCLATEIQERVWQLASTKLNVHSEKRKDTSVYIVLEELKIYILLFR